MKYFFLFSLACGMVLAQTPPISLRVSMIALPWDVQPGTSWPAVEIIFPVEQVSLTYDLLVALGCRFLNPPREVTSGP